jgi:hypothetical protein
MRRKDPGKRLKSADFDGKAVKIGDKLPIPAQKLDIRPKSWVDDAARGPRGVFTNGRDG